MPLSAQFPELLQSDSKFEGIAGHWVAHQVATVGKPALGTLTPGVNGRAVDEPMLDGGALYYTAIFAVANSRGGMSQVRFETPLPLDSVLDGMQGRPDAHLFTGAELHVWEYKYGYSEVSPVEHRPMALYARAVLDEHGVNGVQDQHTRVFFHVVQPRCYTDGGTIRTWECLASDLRGLINLLTQRAAESQWAVPPTRVGEHCHKCSARRGCLTFIRASNLAKDYTGEAMPMGITGHALSTELFYCEQQLSRLQGRAEALREQAEHELRSGATVPGMEIQRSGGSEKWKVAEANVAGFGDMLGVDLRKPLSVLTPNQTRALLKKKGVDGALIAPYIERIPGKASLAVTDHSLIEKAFRA